MASSDDITHEQHFCLKWNNFQANITSQFDALRCDEEFTDVTIACEGQQLLAHKVVLSACSPYFKELFKANPCSHPIVFMRDVEARHIAALMQFMYVGEVNVAQAHLSTFLKTAESLKIRGLTDTSSELDREAEEQNSLYMKPQPLKNLRNNVLVKTKPSIVQIKPVTSSSQDVELPDDIVMPKVSNPASKKCKSETEIRLRKDEAMTVNPFALQNETKKPTDLLPKLELPDYISDEDNEQDEGPFNFYSGEYDVSAQSGFSRKDLGSNSGLQGKDNRKLHSLDPRPCDECGKIYSNLSNLRQHMKLIHYPTFVSCTYCQRQFKTNLYLRRHVLSSHKAVNTLTTSDFSYTKKKLQAMVKLKTTLGNT